MIKIHTEIFHELLNRLSSVKTLQGYLRDCFKSIPPACYPGSSESNHLNSESIKFSCTSSDSSMHCSQRQGTRFLKRPAPSKPLESRKKVCIRLQIPKSKLRHPSRSDRKNLTLFALCHRQYSVQQYITHDYGHDDPSIAQWSSMDCKPKFESSNFWVLETCTNRQSTALCWQGKVPC